MTADDDQTFVSAIPTLHKIEQLLGDAASFMQNADDNDETAETGEESRAAVGEEESRAVDLATAQWAHAVLGKATEALGFLLSFVTTMNALAADLGAA